MHLTMKTTLAAALIAGSASVATGQTLTYGSPIPDNHILHTDGLAPFFARVEADSDGKVKWRLVAGGALGNQREAINSLKGSVMDATYIYDLYVRSQLPVSSTIGDIYVTADDLKVYVGAVNEMMLLKCPQCEDERKSQDIVALAYNGTGPYYLMCNSEINTLDRLQGKKVRAAARQGPMMQQLGATPVSVSSAEIYEALQRGQADCTVAGASWLVSYGLKDVVRSILQEPMGTYFTGLALALNRGSWDRLGEDGQAAVRKNLPQLVADLVFADIEEGEGALAASKQSGAALLEPDDKLVEALRAFQAGEYAHAISEANKSGVQGAEELLKVFDELVAKWRTIVAETGTDKQKYAEALEREVFAAFKP